MVTFYIKQRSIICWPFSGDIYLSICILNVSSDFSVFAGVTEIFDLLDKIPVVLYAILFSVKLPVISAVSWFAFLRQF